MNEKNPTPFEIATDFDLWSEYIDPQGELWDLSDPTRRTPLTRAAFNRMDVDDKISFIVDCFGSEGD